MRKGEGRIEVFAVREDILRLLRRGFDTATIHAKLSAEGRITVRQRQFYNLVRKYVHPLLISVRRALGHAPKPTSPKPNSNPTTGPAAAAPERDHFPVPLQWDPTRKPDWD